MSNFLETSLRQFEYYKLLGDKTFVQLNDEQLFIQINPESNSVAMIVKHLWGNMLSRWTDLLTADGEKEWRNRESEFVNDINTRDEMLLKWEEGWNCLFSSLKSLTEHDLAKIIYIRNQGHSVQEAIIRQLAHYPYHVGQIVYLGKMFTNHNWSPLSIPRGESSAYNQEKFDQEKSIKHFTDEYLKK